MGGSRSSGLGGGAWIFFSNAWGLGAALRLPVDPEQHPGGGPVGEAPGSFWILVILGVKLALTGEVTPSLNKRRNVPLSTLLK